MTGAATLTQTCQQLELMTAVSALHHCWRYVVSQAVWSLSHWGGGGGVVIRIDMTFHYLWSSCTTQWFRAGRDAFSQGWLDQFSIHVYTCIQVQWNLLQVVGTKIMSFFHIENEMCLKGTTILWGKSAAEGYFRHCFEQNCVNLKGPFHSQVSSLLLSNAWSMLVSLLECFWMCSV